MQILKAAIDAAMQAGIFLIKGFLESSSIEFAYKDPHKIVTEYDQQAEAIIVNAIKKAFPNHTILAEESGLNTNTSEYLWIIDPLDGTSNFSHHLPYFAVSIALFCKGLPTLSVIYLPFNKELFTAEAGKEAFLNGKKVQISQNTDLAKTFIALNRGQNFQEKLRYGKICSLVAGEVRTYRCTGSIATDLCYLAAGRYDAEVINGCPIHDIAAGGLLVKEAGAVIIDFKGIHPRWEQNITDEEVNDVIVANKTLAKKLQILLNQLV